MKVQIYLYKQKLAKGKIVHDIVPTYTGYVEVEKLDTYEEAEHIFDLCCWDLWAKEKPSNLHADIKSNGYGHGLCLLNTETKKNWLSKSVGWLVGDEKTISDYVLNNRHNLIWR